VHRIRRFIVFHGRRHPQELGAADVTAFVTWLAVEQGVAGSTQNQALSGVLFLYREVLRRPIGEVNVPSRARLPSRVPVVLTPTEVRALLDALSGVPKLVAMLLYGAGLRLQECLALRVKDLDFERREITVRRGEGQKDRRVMLPDALARKLPQATGPCRCQHHHDLHARVESWRSGCENPARSVVALFTCTPFAVIHGQAEGFTGVLRLAAVFTRERLAVIRCISQVNVGQIRVPARANIRARNEVGPFRQFAGRAYGCGLTGSGLVNSS